MHLYFLRHGKAEERRPGLADRERHLLPEGSESVRVSASCYARIGLRPDLILASPFPRAYETARIVQEVLGLSDSLLVVESRLASGVFRFGLLQEILAERTQDSRIVLVGHEPDLSDTVGRLIGGGIVEMKVGSLAYVETGSIEPGGGVLRWLAPPKLFG